MKRILETRHNPLKSQKMVSAQHTLPRPGSEPASANPYSHFDPSIPLRVKLHDEHAKLPNRGSAGAAGYDLCACKEALIPAKGKAIVPTGISIALPPGTYGRVAPRSGLAVKHFLDVGAGVIDADYRGLVGVVMFNFVTFCLVLAKLFLTLLFFKVQQGERIAQLIIERCAIPEVVSVEV
ncbi:Deoxyuridine 5'-triphosphate nucleotidohydrolase [Nowakowskiella sp. JEL0078]|nr:Deoxyuridine 5'-triphosphate nucleotidohydrolase [Nowakowskiella sp. JEL0078]